MFLACKRRFLSGWGELIFDLKQNSGGYVFAVIPITFQNLLGGSNIKPMHVQNGWNFWYPIQWNQTEIVYFQTQLQPRGKFNIQQRNKSLMQEFVYCFVQMKYTSKAGTS